MPRDSCKPKDGQLVARWGYADGEGPDICFYAGQGVGRADQALLHHALTSKRPVAMKALMGEIEFDPSLVEDLEARGYDLTTLRFSIQKKPSI